MRVSSSATIPFVIFHILAITAVSFYVINKPGKSKVFSNKSKSSEFIFFFFFFFTKLNLL